METLKRLGRAMRLVFALAKKLPLLWRFYRFPAGTETLLNGFANESISAAAYADLMRYMAISWATYRNATGSGARFLGLPSWSGPACDELEGFARLMPLFGAWCASGRDPAIVLPDGRTMLLTEEFKRGILAGTDPRASTYWGDMPGKSNQRIVEAADVALALWLFRDSVWASLDSHERDRVVAWLALADGRQGLDNNWHLFFILIDRVLVALGYPGRIGGARERFERIKEFHLGDGWFEDGPGGRVDYYNAWGFHYALTWIDRIDPDWDASFTRAVQAGFLQTYRYLIGPCGVPILGRSVQYRLAVPAPLVAGVENHADVVSAGEARRALDCVWRYFVGHGALRRGIITAGYHATDPRLVDPYAGPASSLWSLRSLVMAFYYPDHHPFWTSPAEPLPVEREDFDLTVEPIGWRVSGTRATGVVMIEILGNARGANPPLEPFGRLDVLRNFALGKPPRPMNLDAKYGRRRYRSDFPFPIIAPSSPACARHSTASVSRRSVQPL